MRPRNAFRALVFAAVLLLGDKHAFAQQQTALVHGGTPYDPATVDRIRGEIVAVEKFTRPDRGGVGLHLKVKTDRETIVVHLGPSWYLAERGLKLGPRDYVEVLGSRVTVGGEPEIIAAEIRKGEKIVKLRDGGGTPLGPGRARTRS